MTSQIKPGDSPSSITGTQAGSREQGNSAPFPWASPAFADSSATVLHRGATPASSLVSPPAQLSGVSVPADPNIVARPPADLISRLFPYPGDVRGDQQLERDIVLDHFVIERRIGTGGMGAVFLARDQRLDRQVALKVLSPNLTVDRSTLRRFLNEARVAARLDHPQIARVYYYGEVQGLNFIAFEYVGGTNLKDLIYQRGRISAAETVTYVIQVVSALVHTSSINVIHRDIKPSNIIITPKGRAKLVDMGLARHDVDDSASDITVAGTTLGTFDYISPEQAKDPRKVDVRSDIYSLGCTMYHMLAGEPPYPDGTMMQKLLDHQAAFVPDPATKNPNIPIGLSQIVRKMMDSDPARRYPNAESLLADLTFLAQRMGLKPALADSIVWSDPHKRTSLDQLRDNIPWFIVGIIMITLALMFDRLPSWNSGTWTPPAKSDANAELGRIASDHSLSGPFVPPDISKGDPPKVFGDGTSGPRFPFDNTSPPPDWLTTDSPFRPTELIPGVKGVDGSATPGPIFPDKPSILAPSPGSTTGMSPGTGSPGSTSSNPSTGATNNGLSTGSMIATPGTPKSAEPAEFQIAGKIYPSLTAACAAARDDSVIELRYNGRRATREPPINLVNRRITIRGARGYRPVIEFEPPAYVTDASQSRMFSVRGGRLELINVELLLEVPRQTPADFWSLLAFDRAERIVLDNVTATIINPQNLLASFCEQIVGSAPLMPEIGARPTIATTELRINQSLLRGGASAIQIQGESPISISLEDSLFVLQNSLIHKTPSSLGMMAAGENRGQEFRLERITAICGASVFVAETGSDTSEPASPNRFVARNNVFHFPKDAALVEFIHNIDALEIKSAIAWSGEYNYYDNQPTFLITRPLPAAKPVQSMNFADWKSAWSQAVTPAENIPIPWRIDWFSLPRHEATPHWCELADDEALVTYGSSDGSAAGASSEKLPAASK